VEISATEPEPRESRASLGRALVIFSVAAAALVAAGALTVFGVGEQAGALPDWQALVLGITQGLTELLPISSSGHLIIVPWLGNWDYLETHAAFNKTFDVALHAGTLVAVVSYFWSDIVSILGAWFASVGRMLRERRWSIAGQQERLAWLLLIATIPGAAVGAAFESFIEERLGQPWMIAIALAALGVALWLADRLPERSSMDKLRYRDGLALGFAQMLALFPGVSRSGITITGGRLLKLDRDSAARFSFLMAIPIIFGAVVLKVGKDMLSAGLPAGWTGPFAVGVLAAAGSGLLAISMLLAYVRRHDYSIFVLYRIVAAVFILSIILAGVRGHSF
jgi:undecaprenyl-diphosphatase